MRVLPRKVEGAIGRRLIRLASNKMLKDSGLVKKEVVLDDGFPVHYYERSGCEPAILFCHGMTDEAKNLAGLIAALDLPNRLLVPDAIGHGNDLQRVKTELNFVQPTPHTLLETTESFLLALKIERCHAFGYSMGGALVYFLKHKRPDLLDKTVLLSPAIEHTVDAQFLDDFMTGRKNHFCIKNRNDVKYLFRDMSVPHRKKQNPIPKFFLEGIVRERQKQAPPDHFTEMFHALIKEKGNDETMSCTVDVDPAAERLVMWPEHDSICNHEKGKAFFAESEKTIFHSIPDCGHMFFSDGTHIYQYVAPLISNYFAAAESDEEHERPLADTAG